MKNNSISIIDRSIATELLFRTKATIKDLSLAITETTSKDVHNLLVSELNTTFQLHQKVYEFLQQHSVYNAYDVPNQLKRDGSYIKEALEWKM